MRRLSSAAKTNAQEAINNAASTRNASTAQAAVGIAVAYALLEVAYQLGRIADNVPVWGPAEEAE